MADTKAKDRLFYIKELRSSECLCGKGKRYGMSLCYDCYNSLPEEMKQDLWKGIGKGYEEAYEAAVKWLDK